MADLAPRSVVTSRMLGALSEAMDWLVEAKCSGMDPRMFFPERGESSDEAKAVCRACRVRRECLDYAIGAGESFGTWGGLSERERRRVRRQRRVLV